jgi:hypothetical protein
LIAEEVKDLHEAWMKHADQVLGDKEIVPAIYEALAKRHPQSRTRGRPGTPAEVVLRLLVLKHMRNCSYGVLEREVRANLVYRMFPLREPRYRSGADGRATLKRRNPGGGPGFRLADDGVGGHPVRPSKKQTHEHTVVVLRPAVARHKPLGTNPC